jgi:hypothetical protein
MNCDDVSRGSFFEKCGTKNDMLEVASIGQIEMTAIFQAEAPRSYNENTYVITWSGEKAHELSVPTSRLDDVRQDFEPLDVRLFREEQIVE